MNTKETPLMQQFYKIKDQHPDALLLFRVGDFYETFGEDAVKASGILGITLTKRANGSASHIALAGFPYHSLDVYLPKLISAGQRVAICEQLEDPKKTKTIVQRGVTELITPGTSLSDKVLEHNKNNYLAAIHFGVEKAGVAFLDLSTGEFFLAEGDISHIQKVLQSLAPSELLYSKAKAKEFEGLFKDNFYTFQVDDWLFARDYAYEKLLRHFNTHNLKGFGVEEMNEGIISGGVILHYLAENKHSRLQHISRISRLEASNYVWLDKFTVRNLELLEPVHGEGTSLLDVINYTRSPMGGRMLKKWLVLPLRELKPIKERQSGTEYFFSHIDIAGQIHQEISLAGDMERLISRISLQKANPREVVQLKRSLAAVAEVKTICESEGTSLAHYADKMNTCKNIYDRIDETITEEPPLSLQKGAVIKSGISKELDEWREIAYSGKDYLLKIQRKEAERTGISSLKISYNNVFGYYLEVTHTHKDKVPEDWIRKQTLVNAERYITEELKQYEEKILQAEGRILELEKALYDNLLAEISDYTVLIQQNANVLGQLDCLLSLAKVARLNNYVKPEIDDSLVLDIKDGRHPVIEKNLPVGEAYIPNDILLENDSQQVIILTGPNMSGKSAILRQTALITLMAQMGGFVPASEARIGIVDKIFTRVGASDNLSVGESTFMVEMTETANILNNISSRSLIVLDEIGRGTSTYDGISIAWAITEYLNSHPCKPKTLFATHYHELNEIAKNHQGISNFHVSVKELHNKVIFLRKLVAGGSEHSFGIHVAKMAGIPKEVVIRADEILAELEHERADLGPELKAKKSSRPQTSQLQLRMFESEDPILDKLKMELKAIDINTFTPVEALLKLSYFKGLFERN
jgi:DNA mismatch repair protein MutS